jgi:short-chain fatty acids transporter
MPNSFIFAIILTFIAAAAALGLTSSGPFTVVQEWYGGLWLFLEFTMQMALIIVTGHAVASSPLVRRFLERIASIPRTTTHAYTSVILVGAAFGYINWGLGMIVAVFFALQIARVRDDIDFGFLVAAAYAGIWPGIVGSLSVTAPLLVNTPDHFMSDEIGLIPLSETIFSPMILFVVVTTLVSFILLFWRMQPKGDDVDPIKDEKLEELLPETDSTAYADGGTQTASPTIAERLNQNRLFTAFVVLLGGSYIIWNFYTKGPIGGLNLNTMNTTFLMLGLALHGGLYNYVEAVNNAIDAAAQIVLQFPFYGGIQGIIVGTGLATLIVNAAVDVSTASTFPFFAFGVSALLNTFIPSAGGQYITMAPILHDAAAQIGVADSVVVSAYTIGDVSTNMLQPFFALPILGVAGLSVRDIWGYVLMSLIVFVLVGSIATLAFPMLFG